MFRKAIYVVKFVIGSVACLVATILMYMYSLLSFALLPIVRHNKDILRAYLWATMPLLKLYALYAASNRHIDEAVKDIEREAEP